MSPAPNTGTRLPSGARSHSANCVEQAVSSLLCQIIYSSDSIASSSITGKCESWTDEGINARSLYLQVSETAQSHKSAGLDGSQFSVPFQTPATDRHKVTSLKSYRKSTYGNFYNEICRIPVTVWARWLGGLRVKVNMALPSISVIPKSSKLQIMKTAWK
jgi:hypothetical protein